MYEITRDLFCITQRLKQINPAYRVFWNNRAARFEVHTSNNPNAHTFGFIVPYERLDSRTLDYAQRTRKQNADALEAEINAHNAETQASVLKVLYKAEGQLADMLDYACKTSRDVTFSKPIKWF